MAADEELISSLPTQTVVHWAAELDALDAPPGDAGPARSRLTGEQLPDARALHAARVANLRDAFAARRALLGSTASVAEVAEILGVGRQTPHDRQKAGTLLGVKDQGQWRFPLWQLDADGPHGVLPGFPAVLQALRVTSLSPMACLRWFVTPKQLLEGRTPVEALQAGEVEDALAEARAVGAG